jgi:hypothetical protein
MLTEENEAGGLSAFVFVGDELQEVPESHRGLITPALIKVFKDPSAYFLRCGCGSALGPQHYYRGERCPFAGWVARLVREAQSLAAAAERGGEPLTVECFRRAVCPAMRWRG